MNQASLMRRSLLIIGFCIAGASLSQHLIAQSPDARQIMQQVDIQSASKSMQLKASFQVFDHDGNSPKKQFILRRLMVGTADKTLAVFTAPDEIRGVALLSVQEPGQGSQQYLYTPASQRVRSVAAQERSSRFIGTDFSFEEIGKHAADDFTYRLLGDQESMDGRKTYKIEARPVDASRSQYQYIYYWVAQDAPVVLFEQMFGAANAPIRTLHASDIRHTNGIWGARRTEVTTPADGTHTVLYIEDAKFNQPLDEAMFTPEGMAKLNDSKHK